MLALVVGVVLVAGCSGTLVEYAATPATIPDAALTPVGYVHGNTTAVTLSYSVGVGPIARDVRVTAWVSGYSRTTDAGETVALVLVSTPNARVGATSVNPVAQLSTQALVDEALTVASAVHVGADVGTVADLRAVAVDERPILGRQTAVVTYAGTTTAEKRVGVYVHLAVVEHDAEAAPASSVKRE